MLHAPPSAFAAAEPIEIGADDALGSGAETADFLRDAVHSPAVETEADRCPKGEAHQGHDGGAGNQLPGAPVVVVSRPPEFVAAEVGLRPSRKAPSRRKIGRPRKPGPRPRSKPDGRLRKVRGPLTAEQRLDILDAVAFAFDSGASLNTTVDIHPGLLVAYPEGGLRDWFTSGPWRYASQWLERRGVEWTAFATAENYEGERRQHYHLACRCPACHRPALKAMLRSCFPGGRTAIKVGVLRKDGVTYRIKQSTGNATGKPQPGRPTPEKVSRYDGAPVADVVGKRYFLSRSISRPAREAEGWQARRDEQRAVRRIEAKAHAARQARIDALLSAWDPWAAGWEREASCTTRLSGDTLARMPVWWVPPAETVATTRLVAA